MTAVTEQINTKYDVLRFNIDNKWSANEFVAFYESILILYELHRIVTLREKDYSNYFDKNIISINGEFYHKIGIEKSVFNNYSKSEEELIKAIFGSRDDDDDPFNLLSINNFSLQISKIKFSSPGHTDFLGIGTIVKELFRTLLYYFPNKEKRVKIEIQEQLLLNKKIKNLKEIGYTKNEIKQLLELEENSLSIIGKLKKNDKLLDAQIVEIGE